MNHKIAIVGAGFSGLTLAWALHKQGLDVEIFEAQNTAGGLIQTTYNQVPVESAAHALLANADVEELFLDLELQHVEAGYVSKRKWIFRDGRAQKWPLSFSETVKSIGIPRKPKPFETLQAWTKRTFSSEVSDFLVAPAFQGIYATQSSELSATLVLNGIFNKKIKSKRGRWKGSVAPLDGMGDLIAKLKTRFKIHYNAVVDLQKLQEQFHVVVIATDMHSAAILLEKENKTLASELSLMPRASLLSTTISFPQSTRRVRGFGCLFPHRENFESLGVIFNSDLFAKRGKNSETWIMAGDQSQNSSQIILQKILKDRRRLINEDVSIQFCEVHRWPQALPLYGMELERFLKKHFRSDYLVNGAQVSKSVFLTGNYLGLIGLAKILSYNKRLAARLKGELS
jgi:oxygen-dependent protoporphyrinogen oxidase